ncbi:class I SAM-dependent methyltransferase [Alkalicoccus chagannorensis]|uniref:class I SAM-dependent methyltransferase n=1 Tax=Alkalicoccus chagannorensis TaxID=427072 RepID=UPI0003FE086A|nr:class I SAM-dependent methyltransferase [Alkalicoccus chagannorensis]
MEETKTEQYHRILHEGAQLIQKQEEETLFLEALGDFGSIIRTGDVPAAYSEEVQQELLALRDARPAAEKEEIRRALQLAVLQGMKEAVQPHHAMTPDAVSLFAGYLLNLLTAKEDKEKLVVWDPAVGSGNLMTAVINQMDSAVHFVGAEPDETLLKLAWMNAELQEHEADLFHQESVGSPALKNVDAVVSDLPQGYYPDDDTAASFRTGVEEGHSYVHHLLMEQGIRHVKEGGFAVFLVPNNLFQSEQAAMLDPVLKEEAVVYALLQLPQTMFKTKEAGKSILVLRKRTPGMAVPEQALLAELPSFTKEAALADMMKQIKEWVEAHI